MAFSKRLSYSWRLFIPVVGMMWLVLGVLVVYHYKREMNYRQENIQSQLTLIGNQIINAHENGEDIEKVLDFISDYYANSELDDVMVRVYDHHGQLMYKIGGPVFDQKVHDPEVRESVYSMLEYDENDKEGVGPLNMYYFKPMMSTDGRIRIRSAMPFTGTLSAALSATPSFWYTTAAIAVGATLLAFLLTKFLSRSVKMLKEFTDDLENTHAGKTDMPDFPHDELGEISRRIVMLYREKDDAVNRSERQHQIALKAVNDKARVKRQLTNNINHELKTPIGVIRGYLDSVLSTPDMDEAVRTRFLQRAQSNVDRLCNLLDDVSTMTRLEEGGNNIPLTDVDFHDLVFTLEHDIIMSGVCGDMEFSYDLPLNCHVKGNGNLLAAMISNLVKNAALHSHGTEMGLKLLIESPTFYTFAFWDNGVGVSSENLPRLFERFFRIDAGRSRKVGGTGLGLPIVKNTVEAHGGTISVQNRTDGGLEFLFTLPKWDGTEEIANVKTI